MRFVAVTLIVLNTIHAVAASNKVKFTEATTGGVLYKNVSLKILQNSSENTCFRICFSRNKKFKINVSVTHMFNTIILMSIYFESRFSMIVIYSHTFARFPLGKLYPLFLLGPTGTSVLEFSSANTCVVISSFSNLENMLFMLVFLT